MTLRQAALLHFNSHAEAAKKRVGRLKQAGHLRERARKVAEPSILHLTRAGWRWLLLHGHLKRYPLISDAAFDRRTHVSEQTLKHELAIMDIKAAVTHSSARAARLDLLDFCTWPQLLEFTARASSSSYKEITVKPDGFMRLREDTSQGSFSHAFFLELDRSTETQQTLVSRISAYLDFYRSGGFARREGGQTEQYKEFPFRVLVICLSESRKINLLHRLIANDPPIRTFALVTTLPEIMRDPFGSIWSRPADVDDDSHADSQVPPVADQAGIAKVNLFHE
jgi:hypothetical protein